MMTGFASTTPSRQQEPAGAREFLVSLRDVTFEYPGGLCALRDIALKVHSPEVLSVIGPSGCGKSTLLALMADLARPTRGEVTWGGAVRSSDGKRRSVTLVFQQDTLLPWLTVSANVGFGLRYQEMSSEERRSRVSELLSLVGLEDFRDAYPRELSGGMRRRTALLMGLAPLPRLLLLDEPFAALDEPTRVALHQDLLNLVQRFGITVVLVTHDLAECVTLSDRIVMLSRRPGTVCASFDVPFGKERDVLALRGTPEYQAIYTEIWNRFRNELTPRQRTDDGIPSPALVK